MATETTSRRGLSLLAQNKEGIVSLPGTSPFPTLVFIELMKGIGYLAIYLLGADVGRVVIPRKTDPQDNENDTRMTRWLATYAAVSWTMLFIFRQSGVAVSRRLVSPLPLFLLHHPDPLPCLTTDKRALRPLDNIIQRHFPPRVPPHRAVRFPPWSFRCGESPAVVGGG